MGGRERKKLELCVFESGWVTHGRATVIFEPPWWMVKPKKRVRYYIRFDLMHGGIPPPSPPLAHLWAGLIRNAFREEDSDIRRTRDRIPLKTPSLAPTLLFPPAAPPRKNIRAPNQINPFFYFKASSLLLD